MRIAFHASMTKKFDTLLGRAFLAGLRSAGDQGEIVDIAEHTGVCPGADVGVVVGVKDKSRGCFETYRRKGKTAIFIDKGYLRIRGGPLGTLYWRASVNAFQPLSYFRRWEDPQRWEKISAGTEWEQLEPQEGLVFAGSSQKYLDWFKLGDATEYAATILGKARPYWPIGEYIYRPKPSWLYAVPIPETRFSRPPEKLLDTLQRAGVLVTHGSNACFEAVLHGIPTVVLGEGITRDLPGSGQALKDLTRLKRPRPEEVYKLACSASWCMWSLDEFASGLAWKNLREVMEVLRVTP